MEIRLDDLSGQLVQSLLAEHLAGMQKTSPPDSVYALDLSGLRVPSVSTWTAWNGDQLMGIGALKQLSPSTGEIKSMRTDPQYLRQGVGAAPLDHIMSEARRGYRRLSLETGSGPEFEAALSLYRKRSFETGDAFGDYQPSAFNQFCTWTFSGSSLLPPREERTSINPDPRRVRHGWIYPDHPVRHRR